MNLYGSMLFRMLLMPAEHGIRDVDPFWPSVKWRQNWEQAGMFQIPDEENRSGNGTNLVNTQTNGLESTSITILSYAGKPELLVANAHMMAAWASFRFCGIRFWAENPAIRATPADMKDLYNHIRPLHWIPQWSSQLCMRQKS